MRRLLNRKVPRSAAAVHSGPLTSFGRCFRLRGVAVPPVAFLDLFFAAGIGLRRQSGDSASLGDYMQ